uniref:Chitin-binding type-2 domain-containing protein n=1 Tax=Strongyloides venezuelensis TaxID=75913 RepID=A0A0K0EZJ4_STRVS
MVFDEPELISVSDNECEIKPCYSTSTIRSTTCNVGDLMATSNCMSFYFECKKNKVIEFRTCYKNCVFEESKSICGRAQDVGT